MKLKLRFDDSKIQYWADRYVPQQTDSMNTEDLFKDKWKPLIQQRCYIDKEQLRKIAQWKSRRSSHHIEKNDDSYIREITTFSFTTNNERAKIEVLMCLNGVGWPSASTILHFFHNAPYPLLDFRALWSIGIESYKYSFSFWEKYVDFCRNIANENEVSMRTLDRALWQYSRENQP